MICNICPRDCGAERTEYSGNGVCGAGLLPRLARAALHFGEEPCISGTRGSGAVFFSGCALRCGFCQNFEISRGGIGEYVSVGRLAEIFLELRAQGVHNINLVTSSHFVPAVARALDIARLDIPVVFNTSGYDLPETLRMLEGRVDIYLPDMKYTSPEAARRWSAAADYPEKARAAIFEMYHQVGPYVLDNEGTMTRGLMIRHLLLPGEAEAALDVIDWICDTFPEGAVMLSLMSQYTPMPHSSPELGRSVSGAEYERVLSYFKLSGLDGYFQGLSSIGEDEIPDFDLTGVTK